MANLDNLVMRCVFIFFTLFKHRSTRGCQTDSWKIIQRTWALCLHASKPPCTCTTHTPFYSIEKFVLLQNWKHITHTWVWWSVIDVETELAINFVYFVCIRMEYTRNTHLPIQPPTAPDPPPPPHVVFLQHYRLKIRLENVKKKMNINSIISMGNIGAIMLTRCDRGKYYSIITFNTFQFAFAVPSSRFSSFFW